MDERLLDELAELKRVVDEVEETELGGVSWPDLMEVLCAANRVVRAYEAVSDAE